MSPEDILRLIKKEVEEQTKDLKNRLGEVVGLFDNGTAKIQFYGDQEPSEKEYAYLSTYQPVIGDEVALLRFADTYIIAGKNKFQEKPEVDEEIDLNNITGDLNVDGVMKGKGAVLDGDVTINSNLVVKGTITNSELTKLIDTKISSNMTDDSNGNMNIDYMYVDASTGGLNVRRKNGRWSMFNADKTQ